MARLLATAVSAALATLSLATVGWAAPVTPSLDFAAIAPPASVASPSAPAAHHAERWTLCTPGVSSRELDAAPRRRAAMARLQSFAAGSIAEPHLDVVSMPPAPSSLAMVMSGLLAFGAYHTTRVLPRLHLSHIPDWYHAGAKQIGHVTPFDLGQPALQACVIPLSFASIEVERRPTSESSRPRAVWFTPTRAPRSPPPGFHLI